MNVGRKGRPALGAVVVYLAFSLWGCAKSAVGKEPFDEAAEPGTEVRASDAGGTGADEDDQAGGGAGSGAPSSGGSNASTGGGMTGTTGATPEDPAIDAAVIDVVDAATEVEAEVDRCSPGTTLCGELCVDLLSSAANCGKCGHACPGGQACNGAGACLPPAGCSAASYGDHEYIYCSATKNWEEARNICKAWGMDLAVIENADENAFLKAYPGWIALSDISREGTYRWVLFGGVNDGPSVSYTHWNSGEPNNDTSCGFLCNYSAGEDCAEIYADGFWNDARCDRTRAYVCETY